ncbi:MAG: type II toxin-antitoxin system HicA family toxin [Patescibacteria group bacterium]
MPKLPRLSGKEVIKILEQLGFAHVRQKGSHVVLKKIIGKQEIGCVIPMHKELATGTLHGILRQAKIDLVEFLEAYSE